MKWDYARLPDPRTGLCETIGHENVMYATPEEARLKRRLKFHFLNPWEKYEATGWMPWKLMLQIVKVFLGIFDIQVLLQYMPRNVLGMTSIF
jgi:hypothetical protein